MPNSIDVIVESDDAADRLLEVLPHEFRRTALRNAVKAGAMIVRDDARDRLPAPGYPGDKDPTVSLAKTIIVRVKVYDNAVVAIVGPRYLGVNHAHLVEFGHRLVKAIKTETGVTKVQIGFVQAKPFLRPAADETQQSYQLRAL